MYQLYSIFSKITQGTFLFILPRPQLLWGRGEGSADAMKSTQTVQVNEGAGWALQRVSLPKASPPTRLPLGVAFKRLVAQSYREKYQNIIAPALRVTRRMQLLNSEI